MTDGYYVDVKAIGKRIRARREEKNMTLDQLGELTRLGGKSVLSKYENGQTPRLTVDALLRIADALDCEPDYLAGRIQHPQRTTSEISELVPLSREAIESLEHLSYALKEWSDFDSALASGIISSLIVYIVKSLENNVFEHKGFMTDAADLLMALEELAKADSDSADPVAYTTDLYAKLAIRGIVAKMGSDLSEVIRDAVKQYVEV